MCKGRIIKAKQAWGASKKVGQQASNWPCLLLARAKRCRPRSLAKLLEALKPSGLSAEPTIPDHADHNKDASSWPELPVAVLTLSWPSRNAAGTPPISAFAPRKWAGLLGRLRSNVVAKAKQRISSLPLAATHASAGARLLHGIQESRETTHCCSSKLEVRSAMLDQSRDIAPKALGQILAGCCDIA